MMKRMLYLMLGSALLFLSACTPSEPAEKKPSPDIGVLDIVVAPSGDDSAAGTEAAPLATITAAKELAKSREGDEPITVWLRAGTYRLTEPLKFDSTDRGNVTYCAYGDEEVAVSGGQPITGWRETTANGVAAWVADVPAEAAFDVLCDAEVMLPRTRYPEEGYLYVAGYDIEDLNDSRYGKIGQASGSFKAAKEDIIDFRNPENVDVFVPHNWTADSSPVASVNAETGIVKLTDRTGYAVEMGERYYYENVYEAMDKPGEWYLDRAEHLLYYIPQTGESIDGFVLYGADTMRLMEMYEIDGITFRGITFRDSNCSEWLGTYGQSCFGNPGALDIVSTENTAFIDCDFLNIGASALYFGSDNQNCTVTGCTFSDIGFNALTICGTNVPIDDETVSRNFTITNNHVKKYGRICKSGVGIGIQFIDTAEVSNNEVHDGYYTGITSGYVWGHGYHVTRNIHIADNLIYNIGQGTLCDMGGIYLLGEQPGTVIERNTIHDVSGYCGTPDGYGGGNGIYLDQGSSYMTVTKNLVYNCHGLAFTVAGDVKDVVAKGNIFASLDPELPGNVAAVSCTLGAGWTLTLEDNIILARGTRYFLDYWHLDGSGTVTENENIHYDLQNGTAGPQEEILPHYEGAIFADPLFADPLAGDFTLAENSPAFAAGFEAWDYSAAGLLKD